MGWVKVKEINKVISINVIFLMLIIGIGFVRSDVLLMTDDYGKYFQIVLNSIIVNAGNQPWFTFGTWLAPLLIGPFVPLRVLDLLLKFSSICASVTVFAFLFVPGELENMMFMIRHEAGMGYMWHDTFLIMLVTFINSPDDWASIMSGPWSCVTISSPVSRRHPLWFVLPGLCSLFIIAPTMHVFINPEGGLFLGLFETESFIGDFYQKAFFICWIRCYHLICRDCYHTWNKSKFISIFWLLFGSACVLIYVSSAFAFHLAYTSYMGIQNLT